MTDPGEPLSAYGNAVSVALGAELRRTRRGKRWSQAFVAGRMPTPVRQQTVAGYEAGLKVLSVPRLVELCAALDVVPATVLANALQRVDPRRRAVRVLSIDALTRLTTPELAPLQRWAKTRGHGEVVELTERAIEALSRISGLPPRNLDDALAPALTTGDRSGGTPTIG